MKKAPIPFCLTSYSGALARDAAILQRELQKIEMKANRWVQQRKGAEKQLVLGKVRSKKGRRQNEEGTYSFLPSGLISSAEWKVR